MIADSKRQMELAGAELRSRIRGRVRLQVPMAEHTTFRIGGPADIFAEPVDLEDLMEAIRFGRRLGLPAKVVGNGSNLLVGDKGVRGLLVQLAPRFSEIAWLEEGAVVGAGARLGRLVKAATEVGLSGLESTVGIPGTLGGALATNAGTDTGSIGDLVVGATVLNEQGAVEEWSATQFAYRYRYSNLGTAKAVVVSAHLKLQPAPREEIQAKVDRLREKRAGRQPLRAWSAGSVFKNPRGVAAGKVLDRAGAKGMQVGQAEISRKHANFIINRGRATAAEVRGLIEKAHALTRRRYGIDLELEIEMMGE
jgi:UDP-N-acetylmuramate dehydrogenase